MIPVRAHPPARSAQEPHDPHVSIRSRRRCRQALCGDESPRGPRPLWVALATIGIFLAALPDAHTSPLVSPFWRYRVDTYKYILAGLLVFAALLIGLTDSVVQARGVLHHQNVD